MGRFDKNSISTAATIHTPAPHRAAVFDKSQTRKVTINLFPPKPSRASFVNGVPLNGMNGDCHPIDRATHLCLSAHDSGLAARRRLTFTILTRYYSAANYGRRLKPRPTKDEHEFPLELTYKREGVNIPPQNSR